MFQAVHTHITHLFSGWPALTFLALALTTLLVSRARAARQFTSSHRANRPTRSDGVVVGGEGFVLDRPGAPAVLLLHGAGDTPQTLHYLARELHIRGFHVSAPLLPGHGRTVSAFDGVTANGLLDAARASFADLRQTRDWVGLIGLSMGGALAVMLAAENADLPALGLAAPYLSMPRRVDRISRLSWLWGAVVPVVRSAEGTSVLDPTERERNLAYGVFTARALRALRAITLRAAGDVPRVTAPTLMIQSREDNRIAVVDAERAFARLGATEKRLEWITGAAHVITVDYGRDRVIASLASWMEAHRVSR